MNIVIHRYDVEDLEQILSELCQRLDVSYKYDKSKHLIFF